MTKEEQEKLYKERQQKLLSYIDGGGLKDDIKLLVKDEDTAKRLYNKIQDSLTLRNTI